MAAIENHKKAYKIIIFFFNILLPNLDICNKCVNCKKFKLYEFYILLLGYIFFTEVQIIVLPTAVMVYMENIGFVYPAISMMVIGPSLPILRQNRWSLLYDVY
jgi:hypothetical protein